MHILCLNLRFCWDDKHNLNKFRRFFEVFWDVDLLPPKKGEDIFSINIRLAPQGAKGRGCSDTARILDWTL